MADTKKSFILYNDWISVFSKLTDEEAGKLTKHLFNYVNGIPSDLDDRLLEITFEPIKLQLIRDFDKWEDIRNKRVEAGKIGGINSGKTRSKSKQTKQELNLPSKTKQNEANEAVTVLVNVNDTVNVNDNVNVINNTLSKDRVSTLAKTEKEKEFERFNEWIDTEAKYIRKIKDQITYSEYCRITEKYNGEQIRKVLSDLANYKKAPTQYTSVNLTFQRWARKEYQNG